MTEEDLFILEATAQRELIDEYERATGRDVTCEVLVIAEQAAHLAIHAPFEWSAAGDLYFYGNKFEAIFV